MASFLVANNYYTNEMGVAFIAPNVRGSSGFGKTFFGVSLLSNPLSSSLLDYFKLLCSFASPHATLECAKAFSTTDFRSEMAAVNVPTLIIHGDEDEIVPMEVSSEKTANMIPNNNFIVYEDASHGLFYTERERLNKDLIEFMNS